MRGEEREGGGRERGREKRAAVSRGRIGEAFHLDAGYSDDPGESIQDAESEKSETKSLEEEDNASDAGARAHNDRMGVGRSRSQMGAQRGVQSGVPAGSPQQLPQQHENRQAQHLRPDLDLDLHL